MNAVRKIREAKERQFHAIMVAAGVRAPGSRVEDHRPRQPEPEQPPAASARPIKVRDGVQADD